MWNLQRREIFITHNRPSRRVNREMTFNENFSAYVLTGENKDEDLQNQLLGNTLKKGYELVTNVSTFKSIQPF